MLSRLTTFSIRKVCCLEVLKMESRKLFLKGEIKRLKQLLNEIYEYYPYSYDYDNEKRFKKIINLLLEIKEMVITLKELSQGSI